MRQNLSFFAASALGLSVALASQPAAATAMSDVSEIGSYTQVYQLDIPSGAVNYGDAAYGVDNSASLSGDILRIGYYLELDSAAFGRQWVWASMDAFTQDLSLIGVPTLNSGAFWQQTVDDMNVESNAASVVTGTGIATGNIEFWSSCYATGGVVAGIGGNNGLYDWNDTTAGQPADCYGSMQVHNWGAQQTLLAWNRWARGDVATDLGIGNQVGGSGHPDWTFAGNVNNYTVRNFEVWVQRVPEPGTTALLALGLLGAGFAGKRRSR